MNEQSIQKVEVENTHDAALAVFGKDFEIAQRMGTALSTSGMVPERFRGDVGSCLIALDLATRFGMPPIMVMQHMYLVHNNPGFEAKFLIAAIAQSGKYSRIRFVENGKQGDDFGVYAVAKELATGDELKGTTVDWKMVKAEGWYGKNGSKWKTMPEQMFKYRAASFWAKEHDPGLIMGMPTVDELKDVGPATVVGRETSPMKAMTLDDVAAELQADGTKEATLDPAYDFGGAGNGKAVTVEDDIAVDTRRQTVIEMAHEYWGDDALVELGLMCRNRTIDGEPAGFQVTGANVEQLEWAAQEIEDRMAAENGEVE